tara:strand:- start:79 stop:282 length:204 start_codon:yes stop_codon:yes gene_type:complete
MRRIFDIFTINAAGTMVPFSSSVVAATARIALKEVSGHKGEAIFLEADFCKSATFWADCTRWLVVAV